MIDVFHSIADCGDLIHYWDVARRGEGGVLVRLTSGRRFDSEEAAVDAAREIAERVQPTGYEVQSVSAAGRRSSHSDGEWQAFIELQVG
jgi:hypothetical protein